MLLRFLLAIFIVSNYIPGIAQSDTLKQKPLKLNTKNGREQTDNSAGYTLDYASSVNLKKK